MPRVPSYSPNNTPTVEPSGLPGVRQSSVVTPDFLAQPFREQAQQGQAMERFGGTLADIQADDAMAVNQVRTADALNQLRQTELDLKFNPQYGLFSQKGLNALQRQSGQPLSDEYSAKLGDAASRIAESLGNDAQKRAFSLQSQHILTGLQEDAQRHTLQEFNHYHASVADGAIKLSVDEAGMNWNNPQKIDQAINGIEDPATGQRFGGIKQSIYQKAQLTGLSANEAEVAMKQAESSVHTRVIETALENNNPNYGMAYFDKNKAGMTPEDILKVQGQVNKQMDAHIALGAVNSTISKYSSQIEPTDFDRLCGIVLGQESNAKDFNADGSPVISAKGAKYAMQVMPDTAKNPGFGIQPAQSDTPQEYNRVGREYLAALVQKYGDIGHALAAYNAGPGNLDDAIAKAKQDGNPQNWLGYLPKETQDYVQTCVPKFMAGAGAPTFPTKAAFINDALAQLGENPRPEALNLTREQASRQYELLSSSRKEQAEQALAVAQQALIANGGNFAALPPKVLSDLSRYDPGKYDDAKKFAKALSQNDVETNPEAYAMAALYPDELAKMPEAPFLQFLKTNFSGKDQDRILKLRTKTDDTAESINGEVINTTLKGRLASLGINPSPKNEDTEDLARVGAIQKFIRDDIYSQQKQLGRKMTAKEVEDRIDVLFAQRDIQHNRFLPNKEMPMLSLTTDDLSSKVLDKLKAEFAARGNKDPTDSELIRAYWMVKRGRKNG